MLTEPGGRTAGARELRRWLPDEAYYENHLARLAYSFEHLPTLPKGFSCLSIGSWGAEAPYLVEVLGASRVVCVRAPEDGAPAHEVRRVRVAASTREVPVEVFAANAEQEQLPAALADFDVCLAWEVLEHLCQDPPFFLWQAIQTLKIGGYLSLTTPNALWHYLTTAQLYGENALGLKLQPHIPFATHWRLYSPHEVAHLATLMGCQPVALTTFLRTEPFSAKSRLFLSFLEYLRRGSGNGACTIGQHIHLLARRERTAPLQRPAWLFPETVTSGRISTIGPDETPA